MHASKKPMQWMQHIEPGLQGDAMPTAALHACPVACMPSCLRNARNTYVHIYIKVKCNRFPVDKLDSKTHPCIEFLHSLVDKALEESIVFLVGVGSNPGEDKVFFKIISAI